MSMGTFQHLLLHYFKLLATASDVLADFGVGLEKTAVEDIKLSDFALLEEPNIVAVEHEPFPGARNVGRVEEINFIQSNGHP